MTVKILKPDKSYVVYDGKSGKIIHIHHTLSLPGAPESPESDAESDAINLARSLTTSRLTNLKVLTAEPELVEKTPVSRVDLKKLILMPAKAKKRK